MNLQDALDTLTDGDELREMTRHNAADFVRAIAILVKTALVVTAEAIEIEAAERFGVWVRLVNEDRLVTISERFPPGRYLLVPAIDPTEDIQ